MEWHRKAHLALYPGWEKALADTKKNAIAQSEVGGLQLLPAYRNPETKLIEFPEGQLFIDDFPIYSYPLYGMNVWLNSQYLPDEIKPSDNRSVWYCPSDGCDIMIDSVKKNISSQDALKILNDHESLLESPDGYFDNRTHAYRGGFIDKLCRKISQTEGLFVPPDNWYMGESWRYPKAAGNPYSDFEINDFNNRYLRSLGYEPRNYCYRHFDLPSTTGMLLKLLKEGKIKPHPRWATVKEPKNLKEQLDVISLLRIIGHYGYVPMIDEFTQYGVPTAQEVLDKLASGEFPELPTDLHIVDVLPKGKPDDQKPQ